MAKETSPTEGVRSLKARIEKAEYKITDLIECVRLLSEPHPDQSPSTIQQIVDEKLSRQY